MTGALTPEMVGLRVADALVEHTMLDARSRQKAAHLIGASEVGNCRAFLTWMTKDIPFTDREGDRKWPAFVGTAIGERIETAFGATFPDAITQAEFQCVLPSGLTIPCHSDIIDPEQNILVDIKTKDGLALVRGAEPSRQYRYQVAIYVRGAIQNGLLKEGARAFLVYFDRSGKEEIPVVHEVIVDEHLFAEIDEWIDDALYAVKTDTEPPRDQQYDWCVNYCEFFTHCRGKETYAEGLIEDEEVKQAVKVYRESQAIAKQADIDKKTAQAILGSVQGRVMTDTGLVEVSQTWINGSKYEVDRKGYSRLNVKDVK